MKDMKRYGRCLPVLSQVLPFMADPSIKELGDDEYFLYHPWGSGERRYQPSTHRIGPFIEDRQIALIPEYTPSSSSCYLLNDAKPLKIRDY